ncbi:hypothetical protein ACFL9U_06635 [Thermodesulfobacteriota bacterium]
MKFIDRKTDRATLAKLMSVFPVTAILGPSFCFYHVLRIGKILIMKYLDAYLLEIESDDRKITNSASG